MQFYLTENPANVDKIKQKHRNIIVVDLVVNNNIGNPANEKVLEETEAALKSVIAESDVSTFASLRRVDKTRTLEDLRRIICGIRVFNNDAGHCGEGIVNLADIVEKSLEATTNLLSASLESCKKRSQLYCSFITLCLTDKGVKILPNCSPELWKIIKEIYVLCTQHESFLNSISQLVQSFKFEIFRTLEAFRNLLKCIHEKVKYRTAIPTDEIYPKFKDLGVLWLELQDCVYVLSETNLMNDHLAYFADRTSSYDDIVSGMLPETIDEEDETEDKNDETLIPSYLKDFTISSEISKDKIFFSGFCPWALSHGIPLLGKESLGIVSQLTTEKCFIFNSKDFARAALIQMAQVEKKISTEVLTNIAMKIFMEDQNNKKEIAHEEMNKNVKIDQEMQTELHPIPSFFDSNHTNRPRDRAVMCHSTQTLKESYTQTIELEDKNIQTA
ncbi:hypothetical protein DMENIID0001_026400 [Sergentomyia squamirostris]